MCGRQPWYNPKWLTGGSKHKRACVFVERELERSNDFSPFYLPMTTRLKKRRQKTTWVAELARNLSDAIGSAMPALSGKSHYCSCDDETDSIACMCYIMHTPSRKIVLLCINARRNIFNLEFVFHRQYLIFRISSFIVGNHYHSSWSICRFLSCLGCLLDMHYFSWLLAFSNGWAAVELSWPTKYSCGIPKQKCLCFDHFAELFAQQFGNRKALIHEKWLLRFHLSLHRSLKGCWHGRRATTIKTINGRRKL